MGSLVLPAGCRVDADRCPDQAGPRPYPEGPQRGDAILPVGNLPTGERHPSRVFAGAVPALLACHGIRLGSHPGTCGGGRVSKLCPQCGEPNVAMEMIGRKKLRMVGDSPRGYRFAVTTIMVPTAVLACGSREWGQHRDIHNEHSYVGEEDA